ncbi:family 2A encapsulin nanocompartment cargo protein cysteine desulfurase [Phenylobacterium sp. LjRoot225]|uniref:family 2A encapsulin nanocompartment cargo protein cysteine desulfurase n=1 Tax=Phenylobacterium sp. LjRoot225 TaxID=3342285 RepID=UPI003ECD5C16
MTISTPTSASPGPGGGPAGLPDPAEIGRWANALFSALPGQDGVFSQAPTPALGPGAAAAARQTLDLGPLALAPSIGGFGASPTSPPQPSDAAPYAGGEVPGAGLPPLDVSRPGLSGAAPGGELYVIAEAARGRTPADLPATDLPAQSDPLLARSDQLPGAADLARRLGTIDQPFSAPPPAAGLAGAEPEFETAPMLGASGYPAFDVQAVRRDFPILSEKVHGRPLIWFDNGATTQKPQAVIDRLAHFYAHENSNVHRAAHTLAARATDAYENARKTVARFIGAGSTEEIVFVRGATEAINLAAQAWGRQNIGAGDEIIVSHLEHHANIVPWQQLVAETGARLRVIPVDDDGQILLGEYERLLNDRTKIVAVTHVSNALGTVVPIEAIIARAHAAGARVLIDAAQSIAHARIDVQALDADFLVFSGHKVFAPTGIGVLYAKREILNATQPWQGGGNMIADVTFEKTAYQPAPARFEAGTGNLADAAGLAAALEYLERIGLENIARHEHGLLAYATAGLRTIPGLRLFGTAPDKVSVLSFQLDGFAPEEVGTALDQYGIAVRAGHHCAQPILRRFGVEGTVRASLALYNTNEEVDCLISALRQIAGSRGGGRGRA